MWMKENWGRYDRSQLIGRIDGWSMGLAAPPTNNLPSIARENDMGGLEDC
jgi:hypothetical protein